jgi:hypothetical protein
MKNMVVLGVLCLLMVVIVSAGCTEGLWDRLWGAGDGGENLSGGLDDLSDSNDTPSESETRTPSVTAADLNDNGGTITPTTAEVGDEPSLHTPTLVPPTPTIDIGANDDGDGGSFTLLYTPTDGYTAEEGETLAMVFTIVPEGGFDDEVSVTLDLSVPDPVFGIFPLWSETYDMGTHAPPYPPITQTLALDPDNPPEEYAWVTEVYDTARSAGISEIDVNVHVSATGGGSTVEERPVYHVRLT